MTDHELDTALRALTEVDADPALAGGVLARLDRSTRGMIPATWLAAAAAVLVAAFAGLWWYAGRPVAMPRVQDAAPLARSAPFRVPDVPRLEEPAGTAPSSTTSPVGLGPGPIVPASTWPDRFPPIVRAPPLEIAPIHHASISYNELALTPLSIAPLEIASLDR